MDGFVDIERIDVPFVAEFADPDIYVRAMASTGPGYEAIQNVGEAAFADAATNEAIAHIRAAVIAGVPAVLLANHGVLVFHRTPELAILVGSMAIGLALIISAAIHG